MKGYKTSKDYRRLRKLLDEGYEVVIVKPLLTVASKDCAGNLIWKETDYPTFRAICEREELEYLDPDADIVLGSDEYVDDPGEVAETCGGCDEESCEEGEIDYEDIPPYKGPLYYKVEYDPTMSMPILELSPNVDYLEDHNFNRFARKFEQDFPQYELAELMESVWEVHKRPMDLNNPNPADFKVLSSELAAHPDYLPGKW